MVLGSFTKNRVSCTGAKPRERLENKDLHFHFREDDGIRTLEIYRFVFL